MKIALLPRLFYEVIIERVGGKSFSRFFTFTTPLRSRESAMTFLLETIHDDGFNGAEEHVTVYLRHLRSGERVEIISSSTYGNGEECWPRLQRECELYQKEKIKTPIAVYDHKHPNLISILKAEGSGVSQPRSPDVVLTLEQNHHLFFRGKKRNLLSA